MNPICKICGAGTKEVYDQQFGIAYYECGACEFMFEDEAHIVSPEEEKKEYDLHNNSYENEGYVNMFRDFYSRTVESYIGSGRKALDFGSGPEPVLAKILTEEYGYCTDIYDVYYAPQKVYEGQKYDLITCTEVVEHLRNPMEYFTLFADLLAEGGVLAVMTLYHPRDDETFRRWYYRRDQTHIAFYTPKTMKYIADAVGLQLCYSDGKRCCTFVQPKKEETKKD
ncbi:class I SAM-dependent methyltransferase [Aneurinibacillus sp. BA2021]|nr:class I SAM-dependent methyltransferase [Aneurinibacillus sp. BA2021]